VDTVFTARGCLLIERIEMTKIKIKKSTIKPFYIKLTEEITNQMIQDAFDKCVDNGATPNEWVRGTNCKHNTYLRSESPIYEHFGVSDYGKTYMFDDPKSYGEGAIEITLDQLDEHLGIKQESDYDKGMREAMKKIAVSCGKQFGVDIGYEALPELVESLVNPEPEPKEPNFKYVKVEDSIFDLKAEYEANDLYYMEDGGYLGIFDEHSLIHFLLNSSVYRRVEITEEDELAEVIQNILDDWNKCIDIMPVSFPEYLAKSGEIQLYRQ
jgi:hypothetical protein